MTVISQHTFGTHTKTVVKHQSGRCFDIHKHDTESVFIVCGHGIDICFGQQRASFDDCLEFINDFHIKYNRV